MIKFTLHSFTVSHVIDDVMDLRDVISTSAVHGLYNRVNPLSPIPVSSITQQQKNNKKKQSDLYGCDTLVVKYNILIIKQLKPPVW